MNKKIKKILDYHKTSHPGVKIVTVTTTRYYEIPAYASTPTEELLEEWFKEFSSTRSHAFRDQSLLIEHFNDDAKIIEEFNEEKG
jgi:hypothetical protein